MGKVLQKSHVFTFNTICYLVCCALSQAVFVVSSFHCVRHSPSVLISQRTQHTQLSATSSSAVFGHHQAHFTTYNAETCGRRQVSVQCSRSCVRSDVNTDTDTDGVFASPQYFGKLNYASSDEPDYSHTSVGGANRRTSNQVSPPNSALSIGEGN